MNSLPTRSASQLAPTQYARRNVAFAVASLLFALVYSANATILANHFLIDPDMFLHIRVGRWILENGHFPTADLFSYTVSGKTWLATDWLPGIAFAALYRAGGWLGVIQLVALTSALISGVLCFYLAMKTRLSFAIGITVIVVVLISPHFLARPVIISYLLLLVWTVLILEIDERKAWTEPRAFFLIPVMLVWANVHGSFTFGLVTFYLFLGNAMWDGYRKNDLKLRGVLVLLVGVTLAAIATPYGPFSALKTVQLMSDPALSNIDEWRAPDFQSDPFHLASIVGVIALLAYFGIRLRGPRLLLLLLVIVFALEHKRGLGLFSLVAPLLLIGPLCAHIPWLSIQDLKQDPLVRFANRRSGVILFCCVLAVGFAGIISLVMAPQIHPSDQLAPTEALAAATRAGLKDNVLNSYFFGGFLIFNDVPTFVDGRVELYGNKFLHDYFEAMDLTNPDKATQILQRYDVRWALLQPGEPIVVMLRAKGWTELYRDQEAIVLTKGP